MSLEPVQPPQPSQPADPATQPFTPVAPEPGPAAIAAKPKGKSGTPGWINVALGLALAVAIGGVAFAAGRMTAPQTAAANGNGRTGNGGQFFQGGNFPEGFPGGGNRQNGGTAGGLGGRFGGASIQGTVTAVTPDSITIHTATGQDVTVALDSTTTYHQQSSATSSDVKTGGTVIVRIGFGGGGTSETPTGPTANDVTVVP